MIRYYYHVSFNAWRAWRIQAFIHLGSEFILTPVLLLVTKHLVDRHFQENDVWWFMDSYTQTSFSGENKANVICDVT